MVAVFLVDGFELVEALATVDILKRANIKIDTISVFDKESVKSAQDIVVMVDKKYSEINTKDYDVLVLPGGPGTSNYFENKDLMEKLIKHNTENKILAAICAAPMVFEKLGILDGKKATSYPGFIKNSKNVGVVRDGNILTAKSIAYSFDFVLELVEMIGNKNLRDKTFNNLIAL